jgi:CelD/BcsL family acetyltransferase involved in cellulose biosynthesis
MSAAAAITSELTTRAYAATAWPEVAPVWAELERECPRASFFLSEVWVETWIETFGPGLDVSILVFEAAGRAVGACLLVAAKRRSALLPVRRISLNASGEADSETTYIEFNDLLCRQGYEVAIAEALAGHLSGRQWDEITLDGFCQGPAYGALKGVLRRLDLEENWKPSYFVDLAAIRKKGTPYEIALSGSIRRKLRERSRYQAEAGPLRLDAAGDVPAACAMLESLAELNQRRWSGQGSASAFASPRFLAFHRSLIRKCFSAGAIQLLRVSAGAQTVGVLYNFVYRGKVYFYQCGFHYTEDRRLSPGRVTLAMAIQYSLDAGLEDFDFMAGESSHKKELSTGARNLVWAEFRRRSLKITVLNRLRQLKRRMAARASRP